MKLSITILTIIALVLLYNQATFSQTNPIPNYSFENWAEGEPVGWLTSNGSYPGSVTQSADAQDGSYSLKLTKADSEYTYSCGNSTEVFGFSEALFETGLFPISEKYTSLNLYTKVVTDLRSNCYKYLITLYVYKSGSVIGFGHFELDTPAATGWEEVNIPIDYQQPDTPDVAYIFVSFTDSSINSSTHVLFDNLQYKKTGLEVTKPLGGDKWIAGETDTIKWEKEGVDTIDIYYSINYQNGGGSFSEIVTDYPADSLYYVWKIPEDILSKQCVIWIYDSNDDMVEDESEVFTIKGYVLARDSSGQYELFKVGEDGWRFDNSEDNMWPTSWWGQFNYQSGIDPYTGLEYLHEEPFLSAQPGDFPDWPLFVETFGEEQCYWDPVQGLYLVNALTKWESIKEEWGGSCSGFAISSFMAFDNKISFSNAYPDIPNFQNLNDLTVNDAIRKVINKLWLSWNGRQHLDFANLQSSKDPRQTLAELKSMFLSDNRDDSYLYMKEPNTSSAHAVSPYKLWRLPGSNGEYTLWIYDNNHPNSDGIQVSIDSANNTWEYVSESWAVGNNKLYLMDPVSSYYTQPILSSSIISNVTSNSKTAGYIEIYNTSNASITLSDGIGNTIGFKDGNDFNTFPDGIPIIPITSKYHPPIGYYLPDGEFTIRMKEFSDSSAYLNVFADSTTYGYSRKDALSNQQDNIQYGDGLSLGNPDNSIKNISLKTIISEQENEKVFYINSVTELRGDSIKIREESRKNLLLVNYGSATTYDLKLKFLSAQRQAVFEYPVITLFVTSTHHIEPDWSDLSVVPIYIDNGNDDTIDDTLYVDNVVGVENRGNLQIPTRYRLEQNYPNPFNPITQIQFGIPKAGNVTLRIYNSIGQLVKTLVDGNMSKGIHLVTWDATDNSGNKLSSGVYFYRITSGTFTQVNKMMLLK